MSFSLKQFYVISIEFMPFQAMPCLLNQFHVFSSDIMYSQGILHKPFYKAGWVHSGREFTIEIDTLE